MLTRNIEMTLIDVLLERAGVNSELISAGMDDPIFEDILEAMKLIHKGKEALYGQYVYTHGNDPTMFALMEHFADLKRKYIRSEQFMKQRMSGVNIDMAELLDTYSDMAVYAAMGVQLVHHLIKRDSRERASSNDRPPRAEPEVSGAGNPSNPNSR